MADIPKTTPQIRLDDQLSYQNIIGNQIERTNECVKFGVGLWSAGIYNLEVLLAKGTENPSYKYGEPKLSYKERLEAAKMKLENRKAEISEELEENNVTPYSYDRELEQAYIDYNGEKYKALLQLIDALGLLPPESIEEDQE